MTSATRRTQSTLTESFLASSRGVAVLAPFLFLLPVRMTVRECHLSMAFLTSLTFLVLSHVGYHRVNKYKQRLHLNGIVLAQARSDVRQSSFHLNSFEDGKQTPPQPILTLCATFLLSVPNSTDLRGSISIPTESKAMTYNHPRFAHIA